jgi:molybdopterin synthase catalytic subunit
MIVSENYFIEVTTEKLNLLPLQEFCLTENSGALDIFIGTVRDHFDGRKVRAIEYQGYPAMAEKILLGITERAFKKSPVNRLAIQHRIGLLTLKEASVIIVVSAAHRAEAFETARFVIEEIKKDIPVWKKEIFEDGTVGWQVS